MLISSRMSKRILKNRFSGKDRWSNETLCTCFRRVLAYFSLVWNVIRLHTHPPSPYGFDISVNDSWEFSVVVCHPVLKILTLFQTNVVIILLVVLLPGWISVWCNVVWRWWTGICHQQCDIWDHRTREECFVSGLRGELKLVWFFSIFKPFTGKGGQSQAYTRFTM